MSIPQSAADLSVGDAEHQRPPVIPEVAGLSLLDAAVTYAAAGLYVVPLRPGTKIPAIDFKHGSSNDPNRVRAWWRNNPKYGIGLHTGPSRLVVFDLDKKPLGELPPDMAEALKRGVCQWTRREGSSDSFRAHFFFADDVGYNNSAGGFQKFGDVRAGNGIIAVAPTPHVAPDGEYRWDSAGAVPSTPAVLRTCLKEASGTVAEAFTSADFETFLVEYTKAAQQSLLEVPVGMFKARVAEGVSRHEALVQVLPMAYRDAVGGAYTAQEATERLRAEFEAAFDSAVGDEGEMKRGRRRPGGSEFQRVAEWAAAQAVSSGEGGARARLTRVLGSEEDAELVRAAFEPDGRWNPETPGTLANRMAAKQPHVRTSGLASNDIFKVMSAAEWALPVPKPRFLIRGVLVSDTFGVLAGPKKSLKTHENQAIALAVATGQNLYNHSRFEVDGSHKVLYIVGEGGEHDVRRKLARMCRAYGIDPVDVAKDPTFPLYAAFGAAPMSEQKFKDELKRTLDVAQPDLVLIESFYNFHPADVEASNLYQRGQAIDQFHRFVRSECTGATSLMTDHYRSTAGKGNDLDLISMAGQAENADSWITRYHRNPPDVEKGAFELHVSYNSRQWGGRGYDIDWHLGQFDPDTGTHDGEIRWQVHEEVGETESHGATRNLALADRKEIVADWIVDHPSMSKTSSVEALAKEYSTHEKKFRETWSVLEGEDRIYQTQEKLPFGDSGVRRNKAVWKVRPIGRYLKPGAVS